MEHDIRKLFDTEKLKQKELPKLHKEEFIQKLEKANVNKSQKKSFFKLKIAGFLLMLIVGAALYFTFNTNEEKTNADFVFAQVEKIEKEYEANINKEWQQFVKITKDSVLINKYQKKLNQSNIDYKQLSRNLKEAPNNVLVLESLIHNLQQRLQLIKDIKTHLNLLNQKNKSNETIYL